MNNFLRKIVVNTTLRRKRMQGQGGYSERQLAKGFRELKLVIATSIRDIFLILIGIASAAFGLESFLLPSQFIDGGATGIALLLSGLLSFPLALLLLLVNIPFIILGFTIISKQFALRAACAISGLALAVAFIHFPEITRDKLLVSIFGGFFLGAGIGLTVRGGAVLDGTEILAIAMSRKLRTTIGDNIIMINIMVFGSAAYFLSIETALYSMITYLAASKTVDFILEGIEEYTGVTIISTHSETMRRMIIEELGRGVTVYKGKRGFGKHGETGEIDIIYTVITRLEIRKIYVEIEKIDPNAFVVMNSIKDTKGGMIKKRSFKN